ncbi:hypothetical protein [Cupriavidus basilensis]|nr:hypothetical protein [Cupriavidus basilensis]MDR3383286.1 hypothetical protein [Cupriavidus basilensis]
MSWWIDLSILCRLLQGKDAGKSARIRGAMFKMRKLDIALLARAYERN